MLSRELLKLANEVARVQADTIDRLPLISARLFAIAEGVEALEAITVPPSARVIPADVRGNVVPFHGAAE